ncbi:MAG: hypothetical protein WD341_05075 [Tistlia sp.]|uniref:hypothetical protein n=1 Tax=Tistlia sp. TaxID=3057121 RepID=UPI0034A252E7
MSKAEIKRDIDTKLETIQLNWHELATKPHTPAERRQVRASIEAHIAELPGLLAAYEDADA